MSVTFFTNFCLGIMSDSRCFKLLLVSVVVTNLSGCLSVDSLVAKNAVRVGMTKTEVANVILWQGNLEDDAWLGNCFYEYVPESRCEILSGSGRNQFLVFCGAYSESSCSIREGESTLRGVYRTYNEAKRSIAPTPRYSPAAEAAAPRAVPRPSSADERANAAKIQRCTKRGLSPGTPAFKKCFAEQ
jgi:hypothetical protein